MVAEFLRVGQVAESVNYLPRSWTNLGSILPVFCSAFQCQLCWVPIVASMERENRQKTHCTILAAVLAAFLINATICIFALLNLGDNVRANLIDSFPSASWPYLATLAIIAFKCIVIIPTAFLPARLSLTDILSSNWQGFNVLCETDKRVSVTVITLNLALYLAIAYPEITLAADVAGCLSELFIFTIPGLCYLRLIEIKKSTEQLKGSNDSKQQAIVYNARDKLKIVLAYIFIIFGLVMTVTVFYTTIADIVSQKSVTQISSICSKRSLTIQSDQNFRPQNGSNKNFLV